jgi:hypothetical protein
VLVAFFFPRRDEEQRLLQQYEAEDAAKPAPEPERAVA